MTDFSRKGRKLLYFLQKMDYDERRRFRNWLASPLLGNSPQFVKVLGSLEKIFKKKAIDGLDEKQLAELFGQHMPLNPAILKYMGVRLAVFQNKLSEFFTQEEFQWQNHHHPLFLLSNCIRNGRDHYLSGQYRKTLSSIGQPKTTLDFQNLMQLEMVMNTHMVEKSVKPGMNHLKETEEALDLYFILQKLKYACANLIESQLGAKKQTSRLINAISDEIRFEIKDFPLLIQAYFYAFEMLKSLLNVKPDSDEYFEQFLEVFHKTPVSSLPEATDLFAYGQNFCVLKIQSEKNAYRLKLAEIYIFALKERIYEKQNLLSPLWFKNCVELLSKIGMYKDAERIIEDFSDRIHPSNRELATLYNRAVVLFFKTEFRKASHIFHQLLNKFQTINFGTGARVYLCRALWELGDYELLLTTLQAFLQYLQRNKNQLGGSLRKYRLFIQFLNKMTLVQLGPWTEIKTALHQIQDDLEQMKEANLYSWLYKKLADELSDSD